MNRTSAFSRSMAFSQLLSAALAAVAGNMQAALAQVGSYESRGHGRGVYSGKKKGNYCTNWQAHMNSPRECERRVRQRLKREVKYAGI